MYTYIHTKETTISAAYTKTIYSTTYSQHNGTLFQKSFEKIYKGKAKIQF